MPKNRLEKMFRMPEGSIMMASEVKKKEKMKARSKAMRKAKKSQTKANTSPALSLSTPAHVQRTLNPFANEWFVKLRYSHWTGLACPGTIYAGGINYRLNSLFDPDLSGVGRQPGYYSELASLYGKSIVYKCQVELEWSDPSADGFYVGYALTGGNHPGANGKEYYQIRDYQNMKVIPVNNSGKQVYKQKFTVKINDVLGQTKQQFWENISTAAGGNAEVMQTSGTTGVPNVLVQPFAIDPSSSTKQIALSIRLTYYAKLWEFKPKSQT